MTPNKFKQIRKDLSFTQQQMAEALGYERPGTISDKEKGRREVTRQDQIIIDCLQNNIKQTGTPDH